MSRPARYEVWLREVMREIHPHLAPSSEEVVAAALLAKLTEIAEEIARAYDRGWKARDRRTG